MDEIGLKDGSPKFEETIKMLKNMKLKESLPLIRILRDYLNSARFPLEMIQVGEGKFIPDSKQEKIKIQEHLTQELISCASEEEIIEFEECFSDIFEYFKVMDSFQK